MNWLWSWILPFACLVILSETLHAQEEGFVDSISQVIATSPADSNQVKRFNELGWELKFDDPAEARNVLDSALLLAESIGYPEGKGDALNYRGVVEDIHGNPEGAIDYFSQALAIRDSLGDRKGVASLYNNLGNVRENQGFFTEALENYLQSLRIREELSDTSRIMRLYYNISILQENMGNYPEALDFIFQYLELVEGTGDGDNLGNAYNVIGNIKLELDRSDEALNYYRQALTFHQEAENEWEASSVLNNIASVLDGKSEELDDEDQPEEALVQTEEVLDLYEQALTIRKGLEDWDGQAELFNNIALTHKNRGTYFMHLDRDAEAAEEWKRALELLAQAEAIWAETNNRQGLLQLYNGYGDVYRRQGKYNIALDYIERAKALAEEIGDQKAMQNAFKDLSRVYAATGQYELAYEARKQYDEIRYERLNEKQVKDNERREILYSDRKKQYEIDRQQYEIELQDSELRRARVRFYSLIGGAFGLLLLVFLLVNRNRLKTKANRDLEEKNIIIETEKQRSEDLLLNILPAATAEELKEKGKAQARHYEEVSVLFTDFKSFTTIAEQLDAEALVDTLDECFRAFDRITARYGIEKIKTIGDAYMAASGLPVPNGAHAHNMVYAALDIRAFMDQYNAIRRANDLPEFEIRIGIHTGPVVAGVVGNRKFAYDIWGDTVNMAARMEASGAPGMINISASTHQLVGDAFTCTDRGLIQAKGKGEQKMFFVEHPNYAFRFKELREHIVAELNIRLPKHLTYHGLHHTLEVEAAASEIAQLEGVHATDILLLRTAALLHDSGFMEGSVEHEAEGCRICKEVLPQYGYSDIEIDRICRMILATKIPQSPSDHLSAILCDADLDYLGRDDYEEIASQLRAELEHGTEKMTDASWLEIQVNFLKSHSYHTETNRERREESKQTQTTTLVAQQPSSQT